MIVSDVKKSDEHRSFRDGLLFHAELLDLKVILPVHIWLVDLEHFFSIYWVGQPPSRYDMYLWSYYCLLLMLYIYIYVNYLLQQRCTMIIQQKTQSQWPREKPKLGPNESSFVNGAVPSCKKMVAGADLPIEMVVLCYANCKRSPEGGNKKIFWFSSLGKFGLYLHNNWCLVVPTFQLSAIHICIYIY